MKDNEWAWARDDLDRYTSRTVSDDRIFANSDKPLDFAGQYSKCGSCGSHNTFVIYHKSGGNADGTVVNEEILCKDCGKYTYYRFDDRV